MVRAGGGQRGGNGQRQRQPCAQPDELGHGLRLGLDPPGAKPPGQQLAGLLLGEQAKGKQPGPLDGGQPGELAAAGDQHQAAGRARQQRPHLRRIARVVEHHQHPPARQHAAVQPSLGINVGRDGLRRHPQRIQEPPHHPRRGNRVAGRTEPAQVGIQLPIRKQVGHPVREEHCQRGLAHPGHPPDRRDHHRATRPAGDLLRQPSQHPQLIGPPSKTCHRRGQLPRHHPRRIEPPGCCRRVPLRWYCQGGIAGEDLLMQPPQLLTGLHAKLIHQHPAGLLVGSQRVGLTATAVQGQHPQHGEPLPQRLRSAPPGQLTHQLRVPAQRQASLGAPLRRLQLQFRKRRDLLPRQPLTPRIGERRPPPQPKRLPQPPERHRPVPAPHRRPAVAAQPGEKPQVQLILGDLQPVPRPAGDDLPPRGSQPKPQPFHVVPDRGRCLVRRLPVPDDLG